MAEEEQQFKTRELSEREKRFVERLRKVRGSLAFFAKSFEPEIPDCKKCQRAMVGHWSVGFDRLAEPIDGDYGKAILLYLLGDEKESQMAYKEIQRADTRMILEKHLSEGHELPDKENTFKEKPESGYIYLIESDGYYKIGRAKTPKKRIRTYKTENPKPIEVILCKEVEDYKEVEKHLLKKLENKQFRGEWFELEEEDIGYIKSYLEDQKV